MATQESQERLTGMMFGLIWPPTSPDALRRDVVGQLIELQALRGDGLTEEEYAGWRGDVLDGLAANRHREAFYLAVCPPVFGVMFAGGLAYALAVGAWGWAWGMAAGLAGVALLAWRLARALSVKRGLTVAERLAVVEELLGRGLVSAEEAAELR